MSVLGYTVDRTGGKILIIVDGQSHTVDALATMCNVSNQCIRKRINNKFPLDKLTADGLRNRKADRKRPAGSCKPVRTSVVVPALRWLGRPVPRGGR